MFYILNFGLKILFIFCGIYGVYIGFYSVAIFIFFMFSLLIYADMHFKQQDIAWQKAQETKSKIEYTTIESMDMHECEASAKCAYIPEIE